MRSNRQAASIRTLWGLAKSPKLSLSDEELYQLVKRETGKDSLRTLTQGELNQVACELEKELDRRGRQEAADRADGQGRPETAAQRRKIYKLTQELGWADNPKRIQGFIRRLFAGKEDTVRIYRLEWLSREQCSLVIEALKQMAERKGIKDGRETHDTKRKEGAGADQKTAPGGRDPATK